MNWSLLTDALLSALTLNIRAPRITRSLEQANAFALPKEFGNQKNQSVYVYLNFQIFIISRYSFNSYAWFVSDGRCTELPPFERGAITMTGLKANDTATYSCELGHKLVGTKVITCRLGGIWSASPPTCQFVDCGPPPEPEHGSVWLVNGTTTFSSQATFTCGSDYRLQGRTTRLCQEDGNWSSSTPSCKCKIVLKHHFPIV